MTSEPLATDDILTRHVC